MNCRNCVFWCSFDDREGYCDAVSAPEPLLRIDLFVLHAGSPCWTPVCWQKGERPVLVTPVDFYCSSFQMREEVAGQ